MIEAIQAGLTACCLFGLVLLLLICAAIVIAPFVREQWAKARKIKPLEKAVAFVAIAAAIAYGGSKNIVSRFSSDAGIVVTAATINVATNETDATTLAYSYTGTNDVALPLWVRQSVSNEWAHLGEAWTFDGRTYANGTNTVNYSVAPPASNVVPFAMYYVGNDPPPVEIVESGGVKILGLAMSSKAVTITYAVDGNVLRGKTGQLHVERCGADNIWLDLYATNHTATVTNTITGHGFFVGNTTKWRVRMEVEQ